MDTINQTNRSILFEEVNPEKLDLITIIGDVKGIDSLSDAKIKEINENLLVKSFDEFIDKFSPSVYSVYNAVNQKVVYTIKKPKNIPKECISEIKFDKNNVIFKMLFAFMDTRKRHEIKNVDFKYEKVIDMISPKKVIDDIKQLRKEIHYLYKKYEELEEGDPKKLELGDKLNYKFEEASQNYNNVMAMIPLAIEDIKMRILFGKMQEDIKTEKMETSMLAIDDSGKLKIMEVSKSDIKGLITMDKEQNDSLISVFKEDYNEIAANPNSYVEDLVVKTFCPLPAVKTEIDIEKEVQDYNAYLQFYKTAKDDFVKTAKPLIEKMLGIRMYFDQYCVKNKGMQPALVVTNTKLDMIVKNDNLSRLQAYLNTINLKNDFEDTLWFGIVPAVEMKTVRKVKIRRERFKGSVKTDKSGGNTIESLILLLDTIKNYRIQIFFNFQANENTTFNNMATGGIDKYIEKCEPLIKQEYSEFAIPCMPNFTIIPKDKSAVIIDSEMFNTEECVILSKEKEDVLKLWIGEVYIDAAYVAAGITSAYQCPEFLKKAFKNVDSRYPGVRFDIESGDNNLKITTTMSKEVSGFTNTIKDYINRKNFGFIFSSEDSQIDGKEVNRITVYKARSLALNEDGFDSIYKTIVSTYIERILRFKTSGLKKDSIIKFFSNNPNSQKSKWINSKDAVNSIIQDRDDMNYIIDEQSNSCQIELIFDGNVKNLEVSMLINHPSL